MAVSDSLAHPEPVMSERVTDSSVSGVMLHPHGTLWRGSEQNEKGRAAGFFVNHNARLTHAKGNLDCLYLSVI